MDAQSVPMKKDTKMALSIKMVVPIAPLPIALHILSSVHRA